MSDKPDVEKICQSSIGGELTIAEGQILANVMGVKKLKDGEQLTKEGGAANTLFLLAEGALEVLSEIEGKQKVVYTMSEGECAGTRAFVDRSPRKASLRSKGNSTIYTLEPNDFESLLDKHPRIVYNVMRALFRNTHTNLMRMNQESQQLANYISKSGGRY